MYLPSGVPMTNVIKKNMFRPEYMLERRNANWSTRRTFFYGLIKYSLFIGMAGAYYFTDDAYFNDDLNSRPDMQPMRVMCDQNTPQKEKKIFENLYHGKFFGFNEAQGSYFGKQEAGTVEHSWPRKLIRFFYPYYQYDIEAKNYSKFHDINKDYQSTDYNNHYHFEQ
jgi:hypothetical protein